VRHEAYEREGLAGFLRYYDPEIEWTSTDAYIEAATYHGHDGVRRYAGIERALSSTRRSGAEGKVALRANAHTGAVTASCRSRLRNSRYRLVPCDRRPGFPPRRRWWRGSERCR
jgi:hypothetical protein